MIERRVEVRGRRVRYVEAGEGAPIIFAAGLGISADFYKPNIAALAHAGFRAIAPDLPGFGKTRGRLFGSSVQELADHLAAFTRELDIKHAGWIGHSLGCQPLLHIAVQHPDLVRCLVLAGPTGGYERRRLNQIGALASAAIQEPWRLMKAVLRDYMRLSPFNYVGAWLKAANDDPLASAKAVRQPALILVGTRDKVPRPEFLANLSQLLRADVVKLAGGNHGLPLDSQQDFDAGVISFMRRCVSE
jgi:pimeloyl-ACP methyl ester carboxylesterase